MDQKTVKLRDVIYRCSLVYIDFIRECEFGYILLV